MQIVSTADKEEIMNYFTGQINYTLDIDLDLENKFKNSFSFNDNNNKNQDTINQE